MLILTRMPGEVIRIDDDIKVTVLEVHGKRVRIGIDAPKGIAVHREEIYQRIHDEGQVERDFKALEIEMAYLAREKALRGEA